MPRKIQLISSDDPYHISARSNDRDWFAVPMEIVWRIMTDYLHFIHHAHGVEIFNFVLMENHFHLLARFPTGEMAQAMQYFMRETSRCLAQASGRVNHVYGGRYYRSRIRSNHHFRHAYKYIYRNPVEAGIADHVCEYRYSTLPGLLGHRPIYIPIVEDNALFDDGPDQTLKWLNASTDPFHREAIRRALRREVFSFAKDPKTRRPHLLESTAY